MRHKKSYMQTPFFSREYATSGHANGGADVTWDGLNVKTLSRWTRARTKRCMRFDTERDFLAYRFEVLRKWISVNESYTLRYVSRLNRAVHALILGDFLNAKEKNYLRHMNAIVLEKGRALKDLIVNFERTPGEKVFYVVHSVKLRAIDIDNDKSVLLPQTFDVHLTNKALVVHDSSILIRIPYDQTLSFKLSNNGIYWYCRNRDFEIICSDSRPFYEFVKRMFFEYLPHIQKEKFIIWPKGYLIRQ